MKKRSKLFGQKHIHVVASKYLVLMLITTSLVAMLLEYVEQMVNGQHQIILLVQYEVELDHLLFSG